MSHDNKSAAKYVEMHLIDFQIKRAQIFLKETSFSIDEIARNVGYNNSYFFNQDFERYCGMSPELWRKAIASSRTPVHMAP
jgi:two-component system response regulator YesN